MNLKIEMTETEIKNIIISHLQAKIGEVSFDEKDVVIECKSKQNYKSEWEACAFRVRLDVIGA